MRTYVLPTPAAAEPALMKLVEVDPSSYMKCLDVASLYLTAAGDIESAVRVLTIASEHMLVGGQAAELQTKLEEIDAAVPGRLDVVRLLARFCSWQKDDEYLRATLVRLARSRAAKDHWTTNDTPCRSWSSSCRWSLDTRNA
jgi:hypothetical protein